MNSIQYSISCIVWSCVLLEGSACTSRVAQYVGQGSVRRTKVVYRLTVCIHIVLGALTALAYILFQYELVRIFTDKEDVVEVAVSVTPWVALSDFGLF